MTATDRAISDRIDPAWAWARYRPDAQRPWTLALAGHLYRRGAFGANWPQLQQALRDGPQKTIDRLLEPEADEQTFNRTYDGYDTRAAGGESADNLRAWWLRRMIDTPDSLVEKMTLFWHSYFGISNARVKNARLMQQHVQLLRTHALGSFRSMLGQIWRDPAVLLCVDSPANRKAAPNENLPRVLLEDYTVGPGQYTDADLSEAARAFTGWFVLRGKLRHFPREHDDGTKSVLGQTGNFSGDDIAHILLEQPVTAGRVVRRLYRRLISETDCPGEELIQPLAESFAIDYDVTNVVETMLRSNLFFSAVAYRQRVKCPVEFALGTVKALEGTVSTTQLAQDLAAMGQNLYHPPTTKGWPDGRRWLNSATMTLRQNLAQALVRGSKPYGNKLDPQAVAARHGHAADAAGRFMIDLFLQSDVQGDARNALLEAASAGKDENNGAARDLRPFVCSVLALPEYQLA
jgi:uncharacterized protein (DUF1800 family)